MKPLRTLLVDDNETFLNSVARFLSTLPEVQLVGKAGSAEAALGQLEALAPDLIISDIVMPGVNGLDLLRRLPHEGRPRVVMLTAHGIEDYALLSRLAGADGFVVKSQVATDLPPLLRRLAGQHPADEGEFDAYTAEAAVPVLLVEPDPAYQLDIKEMLDGLGTSVVTVGTCTEALEREAHADFALVLVGASAEDGDVYDTARARESPQAYRPPVVVLARPGRDWESVPRRDPEGRVEYVAWPTSPAKLRARVASIVDEYRLSQDPGGRTRRLRDPRMGSLTRRRHPSSDPARVR
ncbi:MAG TPA: response regulator [Gemmataceae bacterium]|nr:response regulator [Gemmataceae bacterium]